jgi:hypothetical protein
VTEGGLGNNMSTPYPLRFGGTNKRGIKDYIAQLFILRRRRCRVSDGGGFNNNISTPYPQRLGGTNKRGIKTISLVGYPPQAKVSRE